MKLDVYNEVFYNAMEAISCPICARFPVEVWMKCCKRATCCKKCYYEILKMNKPKCYHC